MLVWTEQAEALGWPFLHSPGKGLLHSRCFLAEPQWGKGMVGERHNGEKGGFPLLRKQMHGRRKGGEGETMQIRFVGSDVGGWPRVSQHGV